MPTVTLFRSHRSITRPGGDYSICWPEYSWEAVPGQSRTSDSEWFHRRSDPEPIRVRIPPGPIRPADAEAVFQLAARGEPGYRLEEDDVAKRRDDGPTLFGPDDGPAAGPYGPARRMVGEPPAAADEDPVPFPHTGAALMAAPDPAAERARLETIAAELVASERGAAVRRADDLETAARRALDQLAAGIAEDELGRMVTARTILECALSAGAGWRRRESEVA